ncbi:MAG: hypothetical protein AB7O62_09815 [Pirellulales bacterium]
MRIIPTGVLSDLAEQLLLRDNPRLCELGPGRANEPARPLLERLTPATLLRNEGRTDRGMAECCCAALWLYHDFLDESHRMSQEIETPEGSYWHGIMHRREPDADNANYWFRRVGKHSVFPLLQTAACGLARQSPTEGQSEFLTRQTAWDYGRWIDLCEAARTGRTTPATVELCRQIQAEEWRLLFAHCLGEC